MINYNNFLFASKDSDKNIHHGYHRIYPWFLEHLRNVKGIKILEIGVEEYHSINLWKRYFNNPEIHGIDINKKKSNDENVFFYQIDQSSLDQLKRFSNDREQLFHLIIDDGSHVPSHQKQTLIHFWRMLKDGGIYIIEDIETSYWKNSSIYGYKFDSTEYSLIEELKKSIDQVNFEIIQSQKKTERSEIDSILQDVEIISFAYNSVILVKKNQEFNKYYNRNYKFIEKINEGNIFKFSFWMNYIKQKLKKF